MLHSSSELPQRMSAGMELACTESMSVEVVAGKDPAIFGDARVVENLLADEKLYVPQVDYFEEVQTDIKPFMRKVVTTWMLEVCEEQRCQEQILPLAVNCMDRFLCVCPIKKEQLQLLASACLLIASKIRSTNALPVEVLSAYTDHSVAAEYIRDWELLVLSKLQWNIGSITGFDFADQIIERCPWGGENHLVRRHTHTLVAICYTESALLQTAPSLIASACILSAVRGLKLASALQAARDVCTLTRVDPIDLELLVRFIDEQVEKVASQYSDNSSTSSTNKQPTNDGFESPTYGQPETPTEVESIYF